MPELVFLVGCPRSGSTALASVLNRHPDISFLETNFFNRLMPEFFNPDFKKLSIAKLLEDFRLLDFLELIKIRPDEFKTILEDRLSQIPSESISPKDFFDFLISLSPKKSKLICDKSTAHIFHFEKILELYPEAKFIEIIRDGRDVVNSLIKMPWRADGVLNNARYWVKHIKAGKKLKQSFAGKADRFLSIKYEDLMSHPHEILEKLSSFLGLEFNENILETNICEDEVFPEWQSAWKSKSRSKLNTNRISIWQKEIEKKDQGILNLYLAKYLKDLDYKYALKTSLIDRFRLLIEYLITGSLSVLRLFFLR